jgi:hypothetical protein
MPPWCECGNDLKRWDILGIYILGDGKIGAGKKMRKRKWWRRRDLNPAPQNKFA